jgi:hypothetical protein
LTGASGSAQNQTTPIYLHVIPTEVADGAHFDSDLPLRVRVTTADPDALSRALRPSSIIARGVESLTVALPDSNTVPADAPPGPLAPTFLVDYEQAPVAALHEALLEGSDVRTPVAALE